MNPLEGAIQELNWAAGNTAHNLGFIPADKLTWKPAPTAKSALEIVDHVCGFLLSMVPVLGGGAWTPVDAPPSTTLEEARELLKRSAGDYGAALAKVPAEDLGKMVQLPFGTFPMAQIATFPVVDLIHHHGQIAYIQTLLGDDETHFEMAG